MKIKILFTGGTIGSTENHGALSASPDANPLLLSMYHKAYPSSGAEIIPETLMSVLSENMSLVHWKKIYENIINETEADGIIITHGTDTLAFTAAFLSFMLFPPKMPVLLVSSKFPLTDPRACGLKNLAAAVNFIENSGEKGVFVPFIENGAVKIHSGLGLLPARPFLHDFAGITPAKPAQPVPRFPDEKRILYIEPHVNIDYNLYNFTEENKPIAVLHGLYHSGTACTSPESEKHDITAFSERCKALLIDLYVAPCDASCAIYSTSETMEKAGIKFLKGLSAPAAYVKLMIAYGSFEDKAARDRFLQD